MRKKLILIFCAAILACLCFVSCGDDSSEYVVGDIYPTSVTFQNGYGAQSFYIDIIGDVSWRLYSEESWIHVTQSSGNGEASVRIEIEANYEYYSREGSIICDWWNSAGGSGTERCPVWQDGSYGNTGGGNNGGGSNNGGNTGGGNNGGGSNNGGNTGGGNNGGGGNNQVSKPAPPTNVRVENYGSVSVPDVRITWNASSGATSYTVYRSTSASGSYSQIKTTSNTYASDNSVTIGKTYYYKVKASNSAGTSDYSSYAKFEYSDTRKPGPVKYGNCSVSGTNMTLRWSLPSTADYGKPTKALLRVKNPDNDNWVTLKELSGSATSVTFTYTPWICTEQYTKGYVYVGILLENDYGTGGGSSKVYDTNTKKWIN